MAYVRLLAVVMTGFTAAFLIAAGADDSLLNLVRAIGFGSLAGMAWCMLWRETVQRREKAQLRSAICRERDRLQDSITALAGLVDAQSERIEELETRAATEDVHGVMNGLHDRRDWNRLAGYLDENVLDFRRVSPDS